MGRPDLKEDPRFGSRSSRVVNFAAVDELIESWTKTLTKDDVAQRMLAAAVPCAPVRTLLEVMNDKNMHARGSLQWIDHPKLGRVALPHSPLVFEGTAATAARTQPAAGSEQRRRLRRMARPYAGGAGGLQGGRRHRLFRGGIGG